MPGNLNKREARDQLHKLGLQPRGLGLETAAAYVDLSPQSFLREVENGIMPQPRQFGRRKVWDRVALDQAMSGKAASEGDCDPIMDAIHAAKPAPVR